MGSEPKKYKADPERKRALEHEKYQVVNAKCTKYQAEIN